MILTEADLPALDVLRRRPSSVDLFTFSASIGMAHRIHFDADYTREVEGHPALLVQGPLQAAYVTQVIHGWAAAVGAKSRLVSLTYRHRRPLYVDQELVIGGEVTGFEQDEQRATLSVWVKTEGDETPATAGEAIVVLVASDHR